MRIGLIVECGPQGAETKVLPHLAKKVNSRIIINEKDVIPLDKKPALLGECAQWAEELLRRGCQRVIIVWDLLPDWGEYNGKGCLYNDRKHIFGSLDTQQVDRSKVKLVCIKAMLEAWLLADERAIEKLLSTEAHSVSISRAKKTEAVKDPKSAMNTLFVKSGSRKACQYVDRDHAPKLVELLPDLNRLDKCPSFQRFRSFL